jgi:hypothetical protein
MGAAQPGFSQLGKADEGRGRSAKSAGDVEQVAGAGGGAEQGFSLKNAADEDDIGYRDGRLGEVAAGQWGFVSAGECQKAIEEAVHPGRTVLL